jgi:phosphatidylethanolamine-binding protein (PEBP) family uncharacterized protein
MITMKITLKILIPVMLLNLLAFTTRQAKLTVSSSAFTANGMIPAEYSCDGAENSPPLSITGIPAGTKSLALIVHDPDAPKAGGVTHWVAWNLPVNSELPENFKGGQQGQNSDHKIGYKVCARPMAYIIIILGFTH